MYELIGWLGSLMLAVCAVPQFVKTFKTDSAADISWAFLFLWGFGDFLMLIYVWPSGNAPLIFNYGLNAVIVTGIVNIKRKELM